MKIPIPVSIINDLNVYVKTSFCDASANSQNKLIKKCIELWFYIFERQTDYKMFINIHSDKLANFTLNINKKTLRYPDLLRILIDSNIIEVNDCYSSGNFSKSYRINNDLLACVSEKIELDTDDIFSKMTDRKEYIKRYPAHKKLINDLYSSSIDLENFFIYLDMHIGMKLPSVTVKKIHKVTKQHYSFIAERYLTYDRAYRYKIDAIKYNLNRIWVSVSNEGRFYSSAASLETVAVPYILIDNKKTISYDARNSQPLLLSVFIDDEKYKKDCEDGIFYDKLARHTNSSRDKAKVASYRYIFFGNQQIKGKWANALEELYPGFVTKLNAIKLNETLWSKLQILESEIWVNCALSLPYKVVTRHDQIVCKVTDKEIVKETIIKKYEEYKLEVSLDSK